MADVTFREIDEMDAIHGGLARRARAELGVTAWGMQVLHAAAELGRLPRAQPRRRRRSTRTRRRSTSRSRARRRSSPTASEFELRPGTMARVGPEQLRRILPGPDGHPLPRARRDGPARSTRARGRSSAPILRPRGVAWPACRAMQSSRRRGHCVAAARAGDEQAFERLLEPHRARAARPLLPACSARSTTPTTRSRRRRCAPGAALDRFEPRAPFRAWLLPDRDQRLPARARAPRAAPEPLDPDEAAGREPTSSRTRTACSRARSRSASPIGLAFVSVHAAPAAAAARGARPRATCSTGRRARSADVLGDSVAVGEQRAPASARRARARASRRTARARPHAGARREAEARVLRRFVAAWEAVDVDALVDAARRRRDPDDATRADALRRDGRDRRVLPDGAGRRRPRAHPARADPRERPAGTRRVLRRRGVRRHGLRARRGDGHEHHRVRRLPGALPAARSAVEPRRPVASRA